MLLRELSVRRSATAEITSRYRRTTQTSQVLENGVWLDSWISKEVSQTKKADIETGEDQKGT